jgi:parvulin-like peptidyl-prolyl isomerase
MRRSRKTGLIVFGALLILLFAGFAVAQGIGFPKVPSDDVALVEKAPDPNISKDDFDRTFEQSWKRLGLKSAPKEGDAQYDQARDAAMNDLLDRTWLTAEAAELDVTASDREISNEFKTIKESQFPDEAAYEKFLKDNAFTEEEIRERVKLQVLSRKIEQKITSDAGSVSDEQVEEYYEATKENFTRPETRDIRLIVAPNEKKADQVEKALEADDSDKSFARLARKFSTDPSKQSGGKSTASEGTFPGEAGEVVTGASEGDLEGPVEVDGKFYFFKVTKVNPEEVEPLENVEAQIRQQIEPTLGQQALASFVSNYNSKWTSRTYCADGYVIQRCRNFEPSGRPETTDPACFEKDAGDSDREAPLSCPAPVTQVKPLAPGSNADAGPFNQLAVQALPQRPVPPGDPSQAGSVGDVPDPSQFPIDPQQAAPPPG